MVVFWSAGSVLREDGRGGDLRQVEGRTAMLRKVIETFPIASMQ